MNLTIRQSFTVLSKQACLTLNQAESDKRRRKCGRSRRLQICLPQPASELGSSLGVCATPHCVTSFSSFCSPLFDFSKLVIQGLGLSKKLSAIKYSSTLINCSPSPFGWGGGEIRHWIIQGPIRAISGSSVDLDGVCVFLLRRLRYICRGHWMHLLTIFIEVRLEVFSAVAKLLLDAAHKDRVFKLLKVLLKFMSENKAALIIQTEESDFSQQQRELT